MYLTVPIPNRKVCSRDFFIQPADPAKNRIVVCPKLPSTLAVLRPVCTCLLGISDFQAQLDLCRHQEETRRPVWYQPDQRESTPRQARTLLTLPIHSAGRDGRIQPRNIWIHARRRRSHRQDVGHLRPARSPSTGDSNEERHSYLNQVAER